eukprot:CAMPEP_0185852038 /NCGR_PEP_ID=MMETSP1354-20130828/12922_1 /TAXON_ID=708628 /ORGANISM="Erythrolobus madagascarensis, Strain CCMP3276" /LENGTH=255 /DNA_ID=CAMNT_0028553183 /DNA_START=8 /DNA_END=775 /DNA_ORIENTATION=-
MAISKQLCAVFLLFAVFGARNVQGTVLFEQEKPLCTNSCPQGTHEWDSESLQTYFDSMRSEFASVPEKKFQRFESMVTKMLQKQSGSSGKYCFGRNENKRLTRLSTMLFSNEHPTQTTGDLPTTNRVSVPGSCIVGQVLSPGCCPKTWNFNDGSENNVDHMQAASVHTAQCRLTSNNHCAALIQTYQVPSNYQYACACARRGCYIDALVDDVSGSCQDADDHHPTFNNCQGDTYFAANSGYSAQCGSMITSMCPT